MSCIPQPQTERKRYFSHDEMYKQTPKLEQNYGKLNVGSRRMKLNEKVPRNGTFGHINNNRSSRKRTSSILATSRLPYLIILTILLVLSVSAIPLNVNAQPFQLHTAYDLQYDLPMCQVHNEFLPELLHNTGSFGNMFEVRTKEYPVKVTEISFSTDLHSNVTYHAWTKTGTYENHEFYEDSWTKIAEGSTIGLGKLKSTPIPVDSFTPLWIEPQQTQAFLVMLETADIRYNYGTIEGMPVEEHEHLVLLEGKGVASFPPFSDKAKFFAPRVFTGAMKYVVEKPCEEPSTPPTSKPTKNPTKHPTSSPTTLSPTTMSSSKPSLSPIMTKVEFKYLFVVEFSEIEFVTIELQDVTGDVLNEFFNNDRDGDTLIEQIIDDGELYYNGEISISTLDDEEYECDTTDPNKACVAVECTIEISHNEKRSHLEVRYAMLSMKELIYPRLTFTNTKYIGPKPIETINTVQIRGVDYDAFNDAEAVRYLEESVRVFLDSVQDQADIASVKVVATEKVETASVTNALNSPLFRRMLQGVARSRSHMSQDTSSVDLTIAVTGEYQPPPELEFDVLTRESFDNEGDKFIELLKKGTNENFKRVTQVISKEDTRVIDVQVDETFTTEPIQPQKPGKNKMPKSTTVPIVVALSGVCIVSLFFVLVWGKKKNKGENEEQENRSSVNGRSIYDIVVDRTSRRGPDVLHSDPAFRHQQSGRL